MAEKIPCPHCGKTVADANGLYMHVRAKHGRKLARDVRPMRDDEPSMADLVIEAQLNRMMGVPNDDWMETMFGDVLDDMVEAAQ